MALITSEKAMDLAVKYLSFKARTVSEMSGYLKKKEIDKEIIIEVLKRLEEYRYLDDKVYLKNYVENNRNLTYYGSKRMIQDLKKRGISDDLLLTLEDLFPQEEEYRCAELVAKKTLRSLSGKTTTQKRKKVYDKLGRMGYPTEMALEIIRAEISEEEPLELSEDELAAKEKKLREKLNRDYHKYTRTFRNKGIVGKELMFRVKKSLMGRGYPYEMINEKLAKLKNPEE